MGFSHSIQNRIDTAKKFTDCDYIPKVDNAGEIIDDVQIMHNGIKIKKDCYCGNWMTELIRECKGHHEPQEEKVFFEILKKMPESSTMIEIGSYWAYYSMWFNLSIKNAKNYMIDCDNDFLDIGRANFSLNNMNGEFTYGCVPTFDVNNFLNEKNIDFLNILHADIQGYEEMLLNSIENILHKIGYFFISTHDNSIHSICLNFFERNKYIIICEHNLDQSASVDGLIVAKNPKIDLEFLSIDITK